jgi:hypothetical protein
MVGWFVSDLTGPDWLQFVALHSSMHARQISTIRRSLGRPPLI